MNTLSTFYRTTIDTLGRRFTPEQWAAVVEGLRAAPRTLLDGSQFLDLAGRLLPALQQPILAELRKLTEWEVACLQVRAYAYWDDFDGQSPFDPASQAAVKSLQTKAHSVLCDAQALMAQAQKFLQDCPIGNPRVVATREPGHEAGKQIDQALADC